jgi:hypothetical protein
VLDRVSSINDLGVIMDDKMNFSEHVDGFCDAGIYQKTVIIEFRDSYNLKSLYTSLVRSKLEYVSCVWRP